MSLLTLYRDGREFPLERVDTLRELLDRHLIEPTDLVRPGDGGEPLSVADLLARAEDGGEPLPSERQPTGDDPWSAWDDADEVPVDDLVSQLLEGAASEPGGRDEALAPTAPEAPTFPSGDAVEPGGQPRAGRYVLSGDGAAPAPAGVTHVTPEPGPPPASSPPASARPVVTPSSTPEAPEPGAVPRSFVEYVQQQGSVASNLELHEGSTRLVPGGRRRVPFGFWALVIGAAVGLVAFSWYGVVRIGAEKTYPNVADVRGDGGAQGTTDPTVASPGERDGAASSTAGTARPEDRYRAQIPVGLRAFRNTEGLKDALFTDIMNSGAPVRTIRLEAVVVAPEARPDHRRPEEVNAEILLAPKDQDGSEEAVAKTALVLGHYVAKAHVHFQEVVIQTRFEGGVGTAYRTRGDGVRAFYERETDLLGFMNSLERIPQGDYVMNEETESE